MSGSNKGIKELTYKMKSKSFDFTKSPAEQQKMNRTFDFVGLYKSAAETNDKLAEKRKSGEAYTNENPKYKLGTSKRSPNKSKKRNIKEHLDVSQINIDGSSLNDSSRRSSPSKVTSTPISNAKTQTQSSKVKSIMKNTSVTGEIRNEIVETDIPISTRTKKRNKSVSFMLDDNEEVVVKKTKSDVSLQEKSVKIKDKKKIIKKLKDQQSEKENKATSVNHQHVDTDASLNGVHEKKLRKIHKSKKTLGQSTSDSAVVDNDKSGQNKKRQKKFKKQKPDQSNDSGDAENVSDGTTEIKIKKTKKKKMKPPVDAIGAEGEPASKSRKKDPKPDIAEDLENLSIGDNAHSLTNLLDEMLVVDKDKHKKLRQKSKKTKKPKASTSSPEPGESDKNVEKKEKTKWVRRKWNRDKKGDICEDAVDTSVIVENLPLSIMLNYKKLLSEHFGKYGLIKKIGIAEMYPSEESKPAFTTTIHFYSDGAAEQALTENNAQLEGSRIRVKRPLPATETTLVVRSYAELTDQALSSAFLGAGRIRSIRHLVKGKKTIGTTFVEFDGPESVERAIKMAAKAKIGGKKMHVAKYEVRPKKERKHKGDGDSAAEADSEESND